MTLTKDALPSLKDLRPADGTSAAIRAAFYLLKDARVANDNEIARLDGLRPGMLLSATPAEIARNDANLRDRRIYAEQLDVLEAELRRTFTIAKEAEEDAEYAARLDELKAAEAAWNADLRSRYPELAGQLVALLERERDLIARYGELARMPAAGRSLLGHGGSVYHLTIAMQKAYTAARAEPGTFADLVLLPNIVAADALWRGKR